MNGLDILVIGIIVLSGLLAFARGFVKEALSIAAWLGATAAAMYALPYVRPIAERYLPKGPVAEAAAAGVVFLGTLIVLSIITSGISRSVKRSGLSALDRTLGLIFGLVRGALVVCIGFIALNLVLPKGSEQPRWIKESRTLPLVASTTDGLMKILPESLRKQALEFNPAGKLDTDYMSVLRAYSVPGARPPGNLPTLAPQDQQRLNQLIQQLGTSPEQH